jgi:hypothetical protein
MGETRCSHDVIDARIEVGAASSTIRFAPGVTYPEDPPGEPLRRIAIFDLRCAACRKALTKADVGTRFRPGGAFYHPRFLVEFAPQSLSSTLVSRSSFVAAIVLSVLGLGFNNISFATNDYRLIVLLALASATLALVFTARSWKKSSLALRLVLVLFAIGDFQTLVDAGARRLPAVFGW